MPAKRAVKPRPLTKRRSQMIYIAAADMQLWESAFDLAKALDEPLSVLVACALREYKPLISFELGRNGGNAPQAADAA